MVNAAEIYGKRLKRRTRKGFALGEWEALYNKVAAERDELLTALRTIKAEHLTGYARGLIERHAERPQIIPGGGFKMRKVTR